MLQARFQRPGPKKKKRHLTPNRRSYIWVRLASLYLIPKSFTAHQTLVNLDFHDSLNTPTQMRLFHPQSRGRGRRSLFDQVRRRLPSSLP